MTTDRRPDVLEPPPSWRDIDWSKYERTVTVAGIGVNYVDYGTGDAVVLVHGLGGSWQTWMENIPALGENHRVIAVDLPGFGRSGTLPPDAEFPEYVEVLADLLERLRIDDAVVVGHSLGGLVTLCTAMWKSERVRGIVLVSGGGVELSPIRLTVIVTAFRLFSAVFGLPRVATTVAAKPLLRQVLLWPALGDWRTLAPDLAAIQIPLMPSVGFVAAVRAAAAALPGMRSDLITVPTLMIWGRQDRILPVAAARTLAGELADARLAVLDGVGHCAMFEAPDQVNELLTGFLAAHPPPVRETPQRPVELPVIEPQEGRRGRRVG